MSKMTGNTSTEVNPTEVQQYRDKGGDAQETLDMIPFCVTLLNA